jgi:hypothetical protein
VSMTAPTSARLTIDDGLRGCLVLCVVCAVCVVCCVWGRDKLSRVKAEKKLLVKELRALRDLGLYEGPLTYSDTGPAKPYGTLPVASVAAAALEREEVHESTAASSALRDEKAEPEGEAVETDVAGQDRDEYYEGYCSAVLAELTERRAVVEGMRKVDPGEQCTAL